MQCWSFLVPHLRNSSALHRIDLKDWTCQGLGASLHHHSTQNQIGLSCSLLHPPKGVAFSGKVMDLYTACSYLSSETENPTLPGSHDQDIQRGQVGVPMGPPASGFLRASQAAGVRARLCAALAGKWNLPFSLLGHCRERFQPPPGPVGSSNRRQ